MGFFKEYFTFSRTEKNGILVLLIIIILLLIIPKFLYLTQKEESNCDYSEFSKQIDEFENSLKNNNKSLKNKPNETLFYFDPNNTTNKQWKQLGLSQKQIKIINNYTSKGGMFYKKKDFKKIYGISSKLYRKLEPYIVINSTNEEIYYSNKNQKQDTLFDFNPNLISVKKWEMLGLSERQSHTIKKYLQKVLI